MGINCWKIKHYTKNKLGFSFWCVGSVPGSSKGSCLAQKRRHVMVVQVTMTQSDFWYEFLFLKGLTLNLSFLEGRGE